MNKNQAKKVTASPNKRRPSKKKRRDMTEMEKIGTIFGVILMIISILLIAVYIWAYSKHLDSLHG